MKISIYGAGYVGLVSGICFAELGHNVCCIDIDEKKIANLQSGILPIYEENLETLLQKNLSAKRIRFITDIAEAVRHAPLQMIAVGTPSQSDGSADLQYVQTVSEKIGEYMTDYCCVINKSTVPVGTAKKVENLISQKLLQRGVSILFDVVSNPEFLREGRAVQDCLSPDRIIIGSQSEKANRLLSELYWPMTEKKCPVIFMDPVSAELTKYAANAFLAAKVSFINEISQIAERSGANIHAIKKGIGSDPRINEKFLNAGCGFGGSCFPKDILALKKLSQELHYEPHMLNAVLRINDQQQQSLFYKIENYFKRDLKNKTIALWGLAFKPNTDDIRSATSLVVMEMLWKAGAHVKAYDPLAMTHVRDLYLAQTQLTLCESATLALDQADALVIVTEWDEFKNPDFALIKKSLHFPVIFDGRNMYDREMVQKAGLRYFGVGC